MLRSPAAAHLPDNLRLPLESAVASACASPTVTLNATVTLGHAPKLQEGAISGRTEGGGFLGGGGCLPANVSILEEAASPMEGVEVVAPCNPFNVGARRSSEYEALELNAYLGGTEFLQAEPFSQDACGGDGNFTQPLSPSIFHTAQLGNTTAGTHSCFIRISDDGSMLPVFLCTWPCAADWHGNIRSLKRYKPTMWCNHTCDTQQL